MYDDETYNPNFYNWFVLILPSSPSFPFARPSPSSLHSSPLFPHSPILATFYSYFRTVALLFYCDGSSFSGYRSDPVSYNNTNIYFRFSPFLCSHFLYFSPSFPISPPSPISLPSPPLPPSPPPFSPPSPSQSLLKIVIDHLLVGYIIDPNIYFRTTIQTKRLNKKNIIVLFKKLTVVLFLHHI